MAGEIFIARQDTLETVKGTVDGIDSGVKQTNNALGNFSGGGTDTVKTELQTLKNSVAQLQTKVDQLLSKGSGEIKYKRHLTVNDIKAIKKGQTIKMICLNTGGTQATTITLYGTAYINNAKIEEMSGQNETALLPKSMPFTFRYEDYGMVDGRITNAVINGILFEIE